MAYSRAAREKRNRLAASKGVKFEAWSLIQHIFRILSELKIEGSGFGYPDCISGFSSAEGKDVLDPRLFSIRSGEHANSKGQHMKCPGRLVMWLERPFPISAPMSTSSLPTSVFSPFGISSSSATTHYFGSCRNGTRHLRQIKYVDIFAPEIGIRLSCPIGCSSVASTSVCIFVPCTARMTTRVSTTNLRSIPLRPSSGEESIF